MKTAIAAALLLLQTTAVEPREPAEQHLFRALDRFYTWGDVVERFVCRVHGRWLDHSGRRLSTGQFWGDLLYEDGAFRFTLARTLGGKRSASRVVNDIHSLIEQAALLPTGFPVPPGRVVRRPIPGVEGGAWFEVAPGSPKASAHPDGSGDRADSVTYHMSGGRIAAVTLPDGPGRPPLRFQIKSSWIPGDRYLITQLIGRPHTLKKKPRIDYQYHYLGGNYFPRTITEDREKERLSMVFYWYEVDLVP
jgi:hypothetical protein